MPSNITIEDRFKAALTDVKLNSDVLVFDNYPQCCGSCAGHHIEQEHPDAAYVYFINQQGNGLTFVDGKPFNYDTDYDMDDDGEDVEIEVTSPATKTYFSHSNVHAAQTLADALRKFGLTVDWDGTDGRCVTVDFTS